MKRGQNSKPHWHMRLALAALVLGGVVTAPVQADDSPISHNPVGAAIALSVEPPTIGYCRDKDAGRAMLIHWSLDGVREDVIVQQRSLMASIDPAQ